MKIVGISDIHGELIDIIPDCDVLCIAGDISPLKAQRNMPQMISWLRKKFIPWCKSLPCKKVIVVAGNHDFVFQNEEYAFQAEEMCNTEKIIYLKDNIVDFEGKRFYGSPWVSGPANWAFFDPSMQKIKTSMPLGVDVAVFHQPLEACDNGRVLQTPNHSWIPNNTIDEQFHPSFGCIELDKIIEEKKPKLVLTGHVHSGNHNPMIFCDSKIVNVSILDEDYKIKYKPFEIEI